MDFSGIIVGAAVFLIIGICHPIVIKMEYHWGKKSWWVLALAGVLFAVASLFFSGIVSTILGAAAFSAFWGIHEILSQEMRVLRGWFPENPARADYYARRREALKEELKRSPSHKNLKKKLKSQD